MPVFEKKSEINFSSLYHFIALHPDSLCFLRKEFYFLKDATDDKILDGEFDIVELTECDFEVITKVIDKTWEGRFCVYPDEKQEFLNIIELVPFPNFLQKLIFYFKERIFSPSLKSV